MIHRIFLDDSEESLILHFCHYGMDGTVDKELYRPIKMIVKDNLYHAIKTDYSVYSVEHSNWLDLRRILK